MKVVMDKYGFVIIISINWFEVWNVVDCEMVVLLV